MGLCLDRRPPFPNPKIKSAKAAASRLRGEETSKGRVAGDPTETRTIRDLLPKISWLRV
jgi:hypothetical protein